MGHQHNHSHSQNKKVLALAFILITSFMVVEAVGGFITNSLALLSDAGHMLSDSISLGLALVAFIVAEKGANAAKTFGYKRVEILASTFNGLTLIGIAVFILYEAIGRFTNPPEVATIGMLVISVIGLVINIIVAAIMLRGGDTKDNLNMRGAYLHVISDMIGSIGAIIAALLMIGFGWNWADPVASSIVAILVLRSGIYLTKSSIHVLMEHTPENVKLEEIIALIQKRDEVLSIHDVHVWTVTSGLNAFTCHLIVKPSMTIEASSRLIRAIEHDLAHENIQHVTIQIEDNNQSCHDSIWCQVERDATHDHHHHH